MLIPEKKRRIPGAGPVNGQHAFGEWPGPGAHHTISGPSSWTKSALMSSQDRSRADKILGPWAGSLTQLCATTFDTFPRVLATKRHDSVGTSRSGTSNSVWSASGRKFGFSSSSSRLAAHRGRTVACREDHNPITGRRREGKDMRLVASPCGKWGWKENHRDWGILASRLASRRRFVSQFRGK